MTAPDITREEFAVFWLDDEVDPLIIYPEEEDALAVAEMGNALVIRRVLVIESVGEWEVCDRQPDCSCP